MKIKFPNHLIHTSLMCLSEVRVLHVRVVADISDRYILCCCILNPKSILQVHQFQTCILKRVYHCGPKIISVVLLIVTMTFW